MAETSQRRASRRASGDTVRHRSVLETAVDGIVTIDESGVVSTFSAAAERMFGYPADEVIGQNVRLLMPEPFRGEHDGYLADYAATGEARVIGFGRDATAQRKDGTTFPIHLSIGEMRIGGARMFTGIIRDLTQQTAAEDARRESQRELELLAAEQGALRTVAEAVAASSDAAGSVVMTLVAQEAARLLDLPIAGVVRFEPGDAITVPGLWVRSGTPGSPTSRSRPPRPRTRRPSRRCDRRAVRAGGRPLNHRRRVWPVPASSWQCRSGRATASGVR